MDKNHCKKQHSVRLPSFWSTINGAKPLQKTVRRALPLFLHLTFFHTLIKKWCKTIAKNSTSCNHTRCPCHPTLLLTPTPIAKPFQTIAKNSISRASTRFPRPLPLFRFLPPRATPSTSPNARPTRPKRGPTWPKTGPRRPEACPTWPKTALRQVQDGFRQVQDGF